MTAQPSVSRFQVVERPYALPAKCCVCGNGTRQAVDFGSNVQNYGAIYMCVECLGEAARQIGFVAPDRLVAEKLGAEQSVNKYLSENDLVVVSRDTYSSIADAVRSLHDDFSGLRAVVSVPDDAEPTPESVGDDSVSDDDVDAELAPAGQKRKPSRQRRSDDVSDDSVDGELGFLGT